MGAVGERVLPVLRIAGRERSWGWLFIKGSLILSFHFSSNLLWPEACPWPHCCSYFFNYTVEPGVGREGGRHNSWDPFSWLSKSEKRNCLAGHETLGQCTDRAQTLLISLFPCCSQQRPGIILSQNESLSKETNKGALQGLKPNIWSDSPSTLKFPTPQSCLLTFHPLPLGEHDLVVFILSALGWQWRRSVQRWCGLPSQF